MNRLQKRQKLPSGGGLWVLGTPIGNLGDLTPRFADTLEQLEILLCEDTRQSAKLLHHLEIDLKTVRLDQHAEPKEIEKWVSRAKDGMKLGVVSDAGMPGICDPGSELVRCCREEGVPVFVVPGPSALTALISVSGLNAARFEFRGFFPRKDGERAKELEGLKGAAFWFESPHRIVSAIESLTQHLPGESRGVAAKELTKLNEKVFFGPLKDLAEQVAFEVSKEGERGEWCFGVSLLDASKTQQETSEDDLAWERALECLFDADVSASQASKIVSQRFGVAKNRIYSRAVELKETVSK